MKRRHCLMEVGVGQGGLTDTYGYQGAGTSEERGGYLRTGGGGEAGAYREEPRGEERGRAGGPGGERGGGGEILTRNGNIHGRGEDGPLIIQAFTKRNTHYPVA